MIACCQPSIPTAVHLLMAVGNLIRMAEEAMHLIVPREKNKRGA